MAEVLTAYEAGIKAGEELLGTCTSIETDVKEMYEGHASFWAGLDETAMRCDTCDWWCEPSKLDEEGNCNDCQTIGDGE